MGSFEDSASGSSDDTPKTNTYKNTFGGKNNISNSFVDDLDTITPLEEPWFLSSTSSSSSSASPSPSSSSSSCSTWPSFTRVRDVDSSLGGRKGHSYNSRVVSSPTKKFIYRTFQILSVLICTFGAYTLVINVISLTRGSSQLEYYNSNLTISSNSNNINNNNNNNIHEQLKSWLFHRERSSSSPSSPSLSSISANEPQSSNNKIHYRSLLDIQDFYFILNNVSICATTKSARTQPGQGILAPTPSHEPEEPAVLGEGIYFMIIVHSAPSHFAERQAIRSTWGSVKTLKNWAIRLVFLLGSDANSDSLVDKSIFRESEIFGDIVTANFHDTYRNLTYKHLAGYKWALNFCPGATFVLKTDDDAFIDIFQLFEFTTRTYGFHPEDTLLCNVFPEGTKPVRTSDPEAKEAGKKWTVTREEYPHEVYPKYCGGLAYLITPDVLERILAVSETSRFFWIDDVFVTGVLRELVDKEPFYLNLRYSYEPSEYRKWLEDRKPRKIPFMIVHVERGSKFSEEMSHMWRKTMRVWS